MKTVRILLCALATTFSLSDVTQLHAQGTAFPYQGKVAVGANATNGTYDLRFILYDNDPGGSQQGPVLTNSAAVNNGLFTTTLDFGANFPGADRFLEIGVRTNGTGAFTTLSPRQKPAPAPYAITASNVTGVVSSGSLSGTYSGALTLNNASNSFTGSGAGLTSL